MKLPIRLLLAVILPILCCSWGFFAHQRINRLAVFTLPPEMIKFYKKHISYITEAAVNPDRRRFSMPDEAPRHYIDLDHFGDSALYKIPHYWSRAVAQYSEDTLKAYGIVPWHINRMYYQLREAFLVGDPERILKLSAEIGHYIGDAHVPLHTTENYNGQLSGQEGIHGFWESRLPELFSDQYDFFVGKASYLAHPQAAAWKAVTDSHLAVDSVLKEERALSLRLGDAKYTFETKGKQTVKVYSREYAKAYHTILNGMVERRMKAAIKCIGDFWYTAWIDAGQPDLHIFLTYSPTAEELERRRAEIQTWREKKIPSRSHESEEATSSEKP
jgi:hypothetical protein